MVLGQLDIHKESKGTLSLLHTLAKINSYKYRAKWEELKHRIFKNKWVTDYANLFYLI